MDIHEELKNWLVDIGNKSGYLKSHSGDSKPLPIQYGKWHDSHQFDVVWKYRGGICTFEIAFNEVPRMWAEEICLASMIEDCTQIFIIAPSIKGVDASKNYEYRWGNYVSMIGKKVGLKYGAELIFIPYEAWEMGKIEEMKKIILGRLKKLEWI